MTAEPEDRSEFSPEERARIRKAMQLLASVEGFGRISRILLVSLAVVAGFLASWDAVVAKLRAWLGN